mmetsp:Transcript_28242/g.63924  ORF Transcript_28242/g.63924 Transcript_28242/m.63924 type:complete len:182 (-) Transcript_28242:429-974(-)
MLQLLLDGGADTEAKNNFGNKPQDLANKRATREVFRKHAEAAAAQAAAVKAAAKKETAIEKAAAAAEKAAAENLVGASMGGDVEAVRTLLSASAESVAGFIDKTVDGGTALHGASQGGHADVVELLLDGGAAIDAKSNEEGKTALHWASWLGSIEVVQLLLDRGADKETNCPRCAWGLRWW